MANLNYNSVTIAGRLTADVELKTTQSGLSVCSFTVAVNRRTKAGEEQKADFFNVTAWREQAEFISKYFRKASSIFIVGELQNRSWEKDGVKHYATEIVARDIRFVDSKSDNPAGAAYSPAGATNAPGATTTPPQTYGAPQGGTYVPQGYSMTPPPQFEQLGAEDELPF